MSFLSDSCQSEIEIADFLAFDSNDFSQSNDLQYSLFSSDWEEVEPIMPVNFDQYSSPSSTQSIASPLDILTSSLNEVPLNKTKKITKQIPKTQSAIGKTRTTKSKLQYTRDELRSLSSEELKARANEIEMERNLTLKEKEDLKRYTRLIKNREAAQAHRCRKKERFSEMETTIKNLQVENEKLLREIETLKQENHMLRSSMWPAPTDKFSFTKEQKSDSDLEFQSLNSNSLFNSTTTLLPKFDSSMWKIGSSKFENVSKAAGACLFILLFSFGVIMNFTHPATFPILDSSHRFLPSQINPGKILPDMEQLPIGKLHQETNSFSHFATSSFLQHGLKPDVKQNFPRRGILSVEVMDETENETSSHESNFDEMIILEEDEERSIDHQLGYFSSDLISVELKKDSSMTLDSLMSEQKNQIEILLPPYTLPGCSDTLLIFASISGFLPVVTVD